MAKHIVIFDIDGTLADGSHRVHHVRDKPKDWGAYNAKMGGDGVHEHTALMFRLLINNGTFKIYIVSGREDQFREVTEKWLHDSYIRSHHGLYMRPTGDYRSDDIIKEEILLTKFDKRDIVCVFDDRPRVIRMWRKHNIPVFDCGLGIEF